MIVFTAFLTFLAQAQGAPAGQSPAGIFSQPWIMPVLLVVMFYFLLIRPQQRQRKEQQARISALQPGAKVVTTAGIHALVHTVKDRTVVLKVAEGTMIEFDKQSIATVLPKESGDKK